MYSYFKERQTEREALRSKKVQKMMPPKKITTKEIHEQQRRTSVYLHTSKTFSFVFSAFIGGICLGFFGIQLSFAQNSVYEPLRYFTSILHIIESQAFEDISKEELVEGAISGMVEKLDKHSRYFPPNQYQSITKNWNVGLGFHLTSNCIVVDLAAGSPAEVVGLQNGHKVLTINDLECLVLGKEEKDEYIYSEKGTLVQIQIEDNTKGQEDYLDTPKPKNFDVVSDDFLPPKIKWFAVEDSYYYLHIPQFHKGLCEQVKGILDTNPIYGLLIDLRSNGGGYIDEGICLADLFLQEGVITNLIDGKGEKQETHLAQESVYNDTELVILIDSDTASAAELFSGVLQHYKRAQLVGESTYGKSSMQKVYQLDNKSVLKLTVARYSIGDKKLIDEKKPIVPDHDVHTVHPKVQKITYELSAHLEDSTLKKVERSLESLYPVSRGNIQNISWIDDLKTDLQLEKGWMLLKKE